MNTRIKISRSIDIKDTRSIAIISLDREAYHLPGQPIMVKYYVDEAKTMVDSIMAIGIKEGKGRDCYSFVSIGNSKLVRDVVKVEPDVSNLVHDELYVWLDDNDGIWKYVKLASDGFSREVFTITGEDVKYICSEDNYNYFYSNGVVKREDDFFSRAEFESLLAALMAELENLKKLIEALDLKVDENMNNLLDEIRKIWEELDKHQLQLDDHEERIVALEEEVFPLIITTEILGSEVLEKGQPNTVEVKIGVTHKNIDITDQVAYYVNDVLVSMSDSKIVIQNVTDSGDYKITAKSVSLDLESDVIIPIVCGVKFYFGSVDETWIPEIGTIEVLSSSVRVGNDEEFIYNSNGLIQRLVLCFPNTYENITSIKDIHENEYITEYTMSEVGNYKVYIMNSGIQVDNFLQKFIIY